MPNLLDLPNELLSVLPIYLRDIEDFTNAASSCRTLRNAFGHTRPNTILRLAAASAPAFFSPHPHYLTTATARQVSDWAVGDEERTDQLRKAFLGGMDGLFELCLEKTGLTMERIRQLHLARFSIINPLADRIDKMAGDQWYETPDFWSGGVSEPYTVHTEANRATFQLIIYGELFGSTMQSCLFPEEAKPGLDRVTRVEYTKYCLPDTVCKSGYDGMVVQHTGPYAPECGDEFVADQVAMKYILGCGRWHRMWAKVLRQIGPEFVDDEDGEDEWRERLFRNVVQLAGLEWMQLVTSEDTGKGISDTWMQRLLAVRERIRVLERPPSSQQSPKGPPYFESELVVCCGAMWYWGGPRAHSLPEYI